MEQVETIIVGGGQAGLSVSYYLTQQGHNHLILDQAAQPGEAWRNHRWIRSRLSPLTDDSTTWSRI